MNAAQAALSAAQATSPSLTLVRPRRARQRNLPGGSPDGRTDALGDSLAEGAAGGAGDQSASVTALREPGLRQSTCRAPQGAPADTADSAASAPTARADRPLDPEDRQLLESMTPALATALVEVLVGSRTPPSVERWVEPELYERILAHTRVREELSQQNPHVDRPLSTSVPRICEVSDTAVEVALVVTTTRRPRALALRLTRRRSRWRLSEFLSI